MKFTLSESSYQLRDAGEVAFGILVLSSFAAIGAILVAAVISALVPFPLWATVVAVWIAEVVLVLRHYRRATRSWTTERRGGDMLFLVECIVALASFAASALLGPDTGGVVHAIRVCLASFVLLLVLCHVAAYALLRYRPTLKEVIIWTAVAASIVVEVDRNM